MLDVHFTNSLFTLCSWALTMPGTPPSVETRTDTLRAHNLAVEGGESKLWPTHPIEATERE